MDYFSVVILIIATFVFVSDRNVKSIEVIQKETGNTNIVKDVVEVKENMDIIKIVTKNMDYNKLVKISQNSQNQYILFLNKQLELDSNHIDTIIANYIINKRKINCFNLLYISKDKKWSIKRIYIEIINYLNIFNKNDLSTYGVILCCKDDLRLSEKEFKEKLISYTITDYININLSNEQIENKQLRKMYIQRFKNADFSIILKILLLIIASSIITTNLVYSIINIASSINRFILSSVIYYCYSYIIKHIYKPIGKHRILATYIFPFYFIAYIIFIIYTYCSKVIKKVHA